MDKSPQYKIDTVEEFLAHSVALETEAAERYREMADALEVHNNPEVAALFQELATSSDKHAASMVDLSQGKNLPHIAPWDYLWADEDSPEAANSFDTHYKMTPYHVLQVAMNAEKSAHAFYSKIARDSETEEVVRLAQEFAEEESEHVAILESWLPRYPEPDKNWADDLDPPMMHE